MLNLHHDQKDSPQLLSKIEMRLSEHISGVYDIARIQGIVSRRQPRVDAADYLENHRQS
jgi:hypothetical protein